MVPAAQDLGDRPVSKLRRPRELGVFKQSGRETLVGGRVGVARDARNEPSGRFDDAEHGELAAGEHEIADRDLSIDQVVDDALVDAFVARQKAARKTL